MDYRRYNIVNNSLGWMCFVIAAVTYILTLEPTASFWDCPEFISQGYKLEVGHPPGNPIFMLTARFFINIFGSTPEKVAWAVNLMSALLSAATILLLFWTITHLTRRLMVGRSRESLSKVQMAIVMGSGVCGALMYAWSDTFWFSAVEGEVYAFSSFCTALVFWLILKWDNRAEEARSDRYLILIAYIIGISIAVHLLNLLAIPALALVIYYRRSKMPTLRGSLLTLLVSFVLVAVILYGLVPGFIKIAGVFELFFVNTLHLSYNIGVLVYAVLLVGVLIWCIRELYRQKSINRIRISFFLSVTLSGIPFIGSSVLLPLIIIVLLGISLWYSRRLSVRLLMVTAMSLLVIFVGYSSYALLLIRSSANPPMNQNSPDNVFALSSYLNREQYGETPLLFGPSFTSVPEGVVVDANEGLLEYRADSVPGDYERVVKASADEPDRYVQLPAKPKYKMTPTMFFPRMYSNAAGHPEAYLKWIGESMNTLGEKEVTPYYNPDGTPFNPYGTRPYTESVPTPSFGQNLRYFFTYQLNHMYWRYFMWNFAGRQNDLQGNGEVTRGNWISGIPFIDNGRLGDQSLLPDELGAGNKGHNVFYMLPLLMGLLGIALQMVRGRAGIEQFWVVFMLFFMTGIAIVLYLNQYPNQPRERDYAFAGSFYAYAIWVGMGVYGLWLALRGAIGLVDKKSRRDRRVMMVTAIGAVAVGILVPLQVVSQTWDDHDRSGRYTTRDFGMNYLTSVDENGIIFTNGDNDTFPLWYAQEVEGYRTDVRVVNLAYLATDWYANQMRVPSYEAEGLPMLATPADYAYNRMQVSAVEADTTVTVPVNVFSALKQLYSSRPDKRGLLTMRYPNMYIPVSVDDAVKGGVISEDEACLADDYISVSLADHNRGVTLSEILSLDVIASGAQNGWKRPTYFAMTVPDEYYLGLTPYMRNTGLAYQVTPIYTEIGSRYELPASTDKMYDNVMNKFRWGGLDQLGDAGDIYLDETIRRMVTTHRSAMLDLATSLVNEAITLSQEAESYADNEAEATQLMAKSDERLQMAVNVLDKMMEKLPVRVSPFAIQIGEQIGTLYDELGRMTGNEKLRERAIEIVTDEILRYSQYIPYYTSLLNDEAKRQQRGNKYRTNKVSILDLNLSNTDLYIPDYIYRLLYAYQDMGGDLEKLGRQLDNRGINLDDLTILLDY